MMSKYVMESSASIVLLISPTQSSIVGPILIECQYLPPVSFFALAIQAECVLIEQHENYVKSSYRNRCHLAGPDGLLRLSVPVVGGKDQHTPYREVRIFQDGGWKKDHWQSICSCYRRSPYFEYYEDAFESTFFQEQDRLFSFNFQLLKYLFNTIGMPVELDLSDRYEKNPSGYEDWRNAIRPNEARSKQVTGFEYPRYVQVFEPKTGFIPNLSILDLLFAEGPNTLDVIKRALSTAPR